MQKGWPLNVIPPDQPFCPTNLANQNKQISNSNNSNLNKPSRPISRITPIKNKNSHINIQKINLLKSNSSQQSDIDCDQNSFIQGNTSKDSLERSREKKSHKEKIMQDNRSFHDGVINNNDRTRINFIGYGTLDRKNPYFIEDSQLQFQQNKHFLLKYLNDAAIHPFIFQVLSIHGHQQKASQQDKQNFVIKDVIGRKQNQCKESHKNQNGMKDDQQLKIPYQRSDIGTELSIKYLKRPTRRPTSMSDLQLQEWFHKFYVGGEIQSLILSHKVKGNERLYYLYRNGDFQWCSGQKIVNQMNEKVQLIDYEKSLEMYK